MQDRSEPPRKRLIEAGVEMLGSAGGALIGAVLAGPAGAVAGGVAAPAFVETTRWALDEYGQRLLGQREAERAGAAAIYAAERLEVALANGRKVRDDGFFKDDAHGRNRGHEVAEGVLLAAKDSFEERKVRHIGYLLANVAVHTDIDAPAAAMVLDQARSLTWRQYTILAMVNRKDHLTLPAGKLRDDPGSWNGWAARRELEDMITELSLVGSEQGSTEGGRVNLGFMNPELRNLILTNGGVLLHSLLSLDTLPSDDVAELIGQMTLASPGDAAS